MKQFFISMLGALAGIWISIFLLGLLGIITIGVIAASSASDKSVVQVEKHSILKVSLSGEITDRKQPVNFMDEITGDTPKRSALNALVAAIEKAAADDDIEGIYLDCSGVSAGMAQLQAVRQALVKFKESGKWIYAYADSYSQGDYFVATAADSLFINPIGMADIHGLSATTMYFKDLLDKIGVDVQVVKVGTYKSAVEPFILNQSSEANTRQQQAYLGNIWNEVAGKIAEGRGVDIATVNSWADSYTFSLETNALIERRIVDRSLYRHEMKQMLTDVTGIESDDDPRLVDALDYAAAKASENQKGDKTIAVLYAVGDITESGSGGIESDNLVPQILDLAEESDIDGLILRVNSGGGSAYASEQIWEALEQFKSITGKPYYVSMGDVAASGGYYISCGADRIYAEPVTLTGSIGIFGLIPDAHKLLNDKIGIHTSTVATNKGQFPGLFNAMTPDQRNAMQSYVDRGYELFVKRCAEGRGISVDSIKAIAEGRVWDGLAASRIGLVDKLGGLDMALTDMAAELDAADSYKVKEYPDLKLKWWEEVLDMSNNLKTSMVEKELGEFAPLYRMARGCADMSALQCRMDYIMIQ